jgi:hypothetical protein
MKARKQQRSGHFFCIILPVCEYLFISNICRKWKFEFILLSGELIYG